MTRATRLEVSVIPLGRVRGGSRGICQGRPNAGPPEGRADFAGQAEEIYAVGVDDLKQFTRNGKIRKDIFKLR